MFVAGLFFVLRRLERWLHQHIFKVGWLLTQNYKTTTTLYYTFFLPGVLLHELIVWLVAGALNVRAEHAIKYPEPQEIGELRLNFVQISPRAGVTRRGIIALAPLVIGLTLIGLIANNQFQINAAMQTMSTGDLDDIAAGIRQLTSTADFWLWFYFVFTISNTMYPTLPKDFHGWRMAAGVMIALGAAAALIGVGNQAFALVSPPLIQLMTALEGIFLLMIVINIFMTLILGGVEALTERLTGRSATFRKGKMITMTRAEAVEQQRKARERERKQLPAPARPGAAVAGVPSIYKLIFPIPGAPGDEAVSHPIAMSLPGLASADLLKPDAALAGRAGADLIPGEVVKPPERVASGPLIRIPSDFRGSAQADASDEDTPQGETPPPEEAPPIAAAAAPALVDTVRAELTDEVDEAMAVFQTAVPETPAAEPVTSQDVPASQFDRPASPFGNIDLEEEDDDEGDEVVTAPALTRASPFGNPTPEDADEVRAARDMAQARSAVQDLFGDLEADKPDKAPPPVPFAKPASPFNQPAFDDQPFKASSSPFSSPARPAFNPSASDDLDDLRYSDDDLDDLR